MALEPPLRKVGSQNFGTIRPMNGYEKSPSFMALAGLCRVQWYIYSLAIVKIMTLDFKVKSKLSPVGQRYGLWRSSRIFFDLAHYHYNCLSRFSPEILFHYKHLKWRSRSLTSLTTSVPCKLFDTYKIWRNNACNWWNFFFHITYFSGTDIVTNLQLSHAGVNLKRIGSVTCSDLKIRQVFKEPCWIIKGTLPPLKKLMN